FEWLIEWHTGPARVRPPSGATCAHYGRCAPPRLNTSSTLRHGLHELCSVVLHDILNYIRRAPSDAQGPVRAPTPQRKGTTTPDPTARDDSVGELDHGVIISLPTDTVFCVLCSQYVGTVLRADNHFKSTHGGVEVRYECGVCRKSSRNHHSISCHVPKCRGLDTPSSGGTTPAVQCEACGRSFKSVTAVSTHERHVHPDVRNRKRIQLARMRKGTTRWTEQEVALLNRLVAEGYEAVRSKIRRLCIQAQAPGHEVAADPDPTTRLLSPRQSRAVRTGLRERLIHLAESYVDIPGDAHCHVIREWLRGADQIPTLVETAAQSLLADLGPGKARRRPVHRTVGRRTSSRPSRHTSRRLRLAFRQHQLLYAKDRPALAGWILDGRTAARCLIPLEDIERAFRDKWEQREPYRGLGQFLVSDSRGDECFSRRITSRDILDTLSATRNNTALGPDRIGKRALLNWDPQGLKLERILNTWWFTGVIPQCLKHCRTVLLPKSKDETLLADVHNWRPITIGSSLLKLYSRILAERLAEACPLHERQRGFIRAPGCAENVELLRCIMRRSRADRKEVAVVFVDFAKAFDSVSHEHILDVLPQRQVDDHVIGVIRDMYTNVISRVEDGRGGATPEIPIRVGVKQGDPMSPLLFNLALDPLIRTLNELGKGYHLSGRMLVTLAFADDLALVSDTWNGMKVNLQILDAFCELTGLRVQPSKCYGFLRKPIAGDSFTLNDCQAWTVGGSPLNMIGPDESERYLGIRVNPMKGVTTPELQKQYEDWVRRIGRAPLRAYQKLDILRGYTIPRLIYQADHGELGVLALRALDGTTRKAVKKWLHLPLCTTDGLLFAGLKDGGLGLQKLERMVPSIQVRRLHQLAGSTDELVSALICEDPYIVIKFRKLWKRAGGSEDSLPPLGTVRAELNTAGQESPPPMTQRGRINPCNWRNEELQRWAEQPTQGVGVAGFKGMRVSNGWLGNPIGFNQRQYIAALQLRANVYPTLEFKSRGRDGSVAACRRCSAALESSQHILCLCPSVQKSRIDRHNRVCSTLANAAGAAGWTVHRERSFRLPHGRSIRPDLVLTQGQVVLVADVAVCYERTSDTLAEACSRKKDHYKKYGQVIKATMSAGVVKFFGFPVGARGLWHPGNYELLSEMGLSSRSASRLAARLCRTALVGSTRVLRDFYRVPGWLAGRR
uniref:Reverse transcriptase domain-containing protein n=1 Tax=Pygocentrus nattereri TaxID=42514 RepID=A0AAR2L5M9_PYGNA